MSLTVLSLSIGTMACLHEGPFMIMLRQDFGLSSPLMIFWIFTILLL